MGQTSSKTNTKQWMGQTLNGKTLYQTNMELEKESSRTNIEWEKHQVGQTMRWTNIAWDKYKADSQTEAESQKKVESQKKG